MITLMLQKLKCFSSFAMGFVVLDRCGVGPGRILPEPGKILHSLDVGSTSSWRNSTGEKQRYERCGTAIRTSTPLRGPLHHLACLQLPLSPVRNVVLGLENKQQPWAWNCYSFWLDTVCSNPETNIWRQWKWTIKYPLMNLNDIVWQSLI